MKSHVVLISGKQGSGKTTLAKAVQAKFAANEFKGWACYNYTFAEPLYQMHDFCRGILKNHGIDLKHEIKDGNLLQLLGTEWGRNTIDVDVWPRILRAKHGF